ncbi:hypothetical protein ADIS_3528 [Lunatimonas lonarensis]|uniref:Uncharacterized protein n=1 Tax=Lunatimonas lonarensis TaxID=1232681 RepID=R7ZPB4_9BACT|nr:hypothetical protein ADIS_3528 [Lunatimonas lonarensis]
MGTDHLTDANGWNKLPKYRHRVFWRGNVEALFMPRKGDRLFLPSFLAHFLSSSNDQDYH